MTALLPNGDKVEFSLSEGEVASVPTGKVWVVTVGVVSGGALLVKNSSGVVTELDSSATDIETETKITLHEGATVETSSLGSDQGGGSGWEFDYST